MLLFVLVVSITVIVIVLVLITQNRSMVEENTVFKDQIDRLQIEKHTLEVKCQDTIQQYTTYQKTVEQEKELEKDKEKRRRVTKTDREVVLERDNETCQICGISKAFLNSYCKGLGDYLLLEIDHIQPVAKGGTGKNLSNLQCLCWRCNRKKGDRKTNEEVQNSINYGIEFLEKSKNETKKSRHN